MSDPPYVTLTTAHAQSGVGWTSLGAKVGESQGADLWSLGDNLLLKGAEYEARFNLNGTVPYDPSWYRCEAVLVDGPWANISYDSFGVNTNHPVWDQIYYEYVVKRGIQSDWVTKAKETIQERNITTADHPSWGDLIWAIDNGTSQG